MIARSLTRFVMVFLIACILMSAAAPLTPSPISARQEPQITPISTASLPLIGSGEVFTRKGFQLTLQQSNQVETYAELYARRQYLTRQPLLWEACFELTNHYDQPMIWRAEIPQIYLITTSGQQIPASGGVAFHTAEGKTMGFTGQGTVNFYVAIGAQGDQVVYLYADGGLHLEVLVPAGGSTSIGLLFAVDESDGIQGILFPGMAVFSAAPQSAAAPDI